MNKPFFMQSGLEIKIKIRLKQAYLGFRIADL